MKVASLLTSPVLASMLYWSCSRANSAEYTNWKCFSPLSLSLPLSLLLLLLPLLSLSLSLSVDAVSVLVSAIIPMPPAMKDGGFIHSSLLGPNINL